MEVRAAYRAALRAAAHFPLPSYRPKLREMVRELFEVRRGETDAAVVAGLLARARTATAAVRAFGSADPAIIERFLSYDRRKADKPAAPT